MRELQISKDLKLPEDTVTSTILVYGGKGMGKTNCGAVLVEELSHSGLRWSVLDPMGVWYGIRHSSDGKGRGVECLILGGPHGDIPIEPTGGAIVADLVADENVNVVIDFSRKPTGEMWGVGEKIRFVGDYGKQLFRRQGSLVDGRRREPLFQMIDEAARFMPQMIRAGEPQLAMCLSTWATIIEEGRNIGLGVGLLTQRSARLNKDVAELADMMLAFRTVGPNSIAAVMDWLGEHVPKDRVKKMIEELRSLPVGSALAVSPGWLHIENEKIVHIRARQTFDSSATPKPGQRSKQVSGKGAMPDLAKYAERMKETIERVKTEDPKALRQRIAQLEAEATREKAATPKPAAAPATPAVQLKPDPEAIQAIVESEVSRYLNTVHGLILKSLGTRLNKLIADLATQANNLGDFMVTLENPDSWKLEKLSTDARQAIRKVPMVAAVTPARPQAQPTARPVAQSLAPRAPSAPANLEAGINEPKQAILNAIATFVAAGVPPRVAHIASFCGTTKRSRGFEENIRQMKAAGFIRVQNDIAQETGANGIPATMESGMATLKAVLSEPQYQMLEGVRATPGIDAEALAIFMGTTLRARGFEENLRRLRADDLLVGGKDCLRVADWLT